MVKDRFNEYYTKLFNHLAEDYPSLQKSTQFTSKPAKLPAIYVRQISGGAKITTLSGTSEERTIGIEVQFFATKQNDVRKMADNAMGFMIESLNFGCPYAQPEENTEDTSIYRYICRFEKNDM